ncbi:hypothetical protein L7F22_067143 [Adiantum nelumboides]|nr:hypothetical protein [Adiantum nelumboides]
MHAGGRPSTSSSPFAGENGYDDNDEHASKGEVVECGDDEALEAKGPVLDDTLDANLDFVGVVPLEWQSGDRMEQEPLDTFWSLPALNRLVYDKLPCPELSFHVVANLVKALPRQGHHFFFDWYFTSIKLLEHLRNEGQGGTGTYVSNRMNFPGNLSLPTPEPCNLSPAKNPTATTTRVLTQGALALSPLSPLPSPADLTKTPTGHNTPLALKDLLGFETVDRRYRKPNSTFAQIAFHFSCCKVVNPEMESSSNGQESFPLAALRVQKAEGIWQGSKSRWTGLCPCMFVSVEKQIVKGSDVDATKPGQTTQTDRFSCLISKQHNVLSNGHMKDISETMQKIALNAAMDKEMAHKKHANEEKVAIPASSVDRTKPVTELGSMPVHIEQRSALPEHLHSVADHKNLFDRSGRTISHRIIDHLSAQHDHYLSSGAIMGVSVVEGRQAFAAKKETYFVVKDRFLPAGSTPSKVSKTRATASSQKSGAHWVPRWLKDAKSHQEGAICSPSLPFGSAEDCALETLNHLKGLGSEEESSLLQADSYESSDTFSISSHSPWLNDQPKPAALSNASVDLEAKAKPWALTEDHAFIPTFGYKSGIEGYKKSKREHTKALLQSYHGTCMPNPLFVTYDELDADASIPSTEADIVNDYQKPVVSSVAHDCITNCSQMTKAFAHKQVMIHHHSKSDTEIKHAGQEVNSSCRTNKSLIKASKDDTLPIFRSKTDRIMLPSRIYPNSNQESAHSSTLAFNSWHEKRNISTLMPIKTAHQVKSDRIRLPSWPTRSSNVDQEVNQSSAQAKEQVKGRSLTMEKKTQDPVVDFTDAMLDFILQNHLCSSKELEELLQCFLSINHVEHHDVIVQAFTEVWERVVIGKAV